MWCIGRCVGPCLCHAASDSNGHRSATLVDLWYLNNFDINCHEKGRYRHLPSPSTLILTQDELQQLLWSHNLYSTTIKSYLYWQWTNVLPLIIIKFDFSLFAHSFIKSSDLFSDVGVWLEMISSGSTATVWCYIRSQPRRLKGKRQQTDP